MRPETDHAGGKKMQLRSDLVPAKEQHREKARLEEKCKDAFRGQGRTDGDGPADLFGGRIFDRQARTGPFDPSTIQRWPFRYQIALAPQTVELTLKEGEPKDAGTI